MSVTLDKLRAEIDGRLRGRDAAPLGGGHRRSLLDRAIDLMEAAAGHWVTIEDEDGISTHVFLGAGGMVQKGPKHLIGSNVAHLPAGPHRTTHHKEGHVPSSHNDHPDYHEHQMKKLVHGKYGSDHGTWVDNPLPKVKESEHEARLHNALQRAREHHTKKQVEAGTAGAADFHAHHAYKHLHELHAKGKITHSEHAQQVAHINEAHKNARIEETKSPSHSTLSASHAKLTAAHISLKKQNEANASQTAKGGSPSGPTTLALPKHEPPKTAVSTPATPATPTTDQKSETMKNNVKIWSKDVKHALDEAKDKKAIDVGEYNQLNLRMSALVGHVLNGDNHAEAAYTALKFTSSASNEITALKKYVAPYEVERAHIMKLDELDHSSLTHDEAREVEKKIQGLYDDAMTTLHRASVDALGAVKTTPEVKGTTGLSQPISLKGYQNQVKAVTLAPNPSKVTKARSKSGADLQDRLQDEAKNSQHAKTAVCRSLGTAMKAKGVTTEDCAAAQALIMNDYHMSDPHEKFASANLGAWADSSTDDNRTSWAMHITVDRIFGLGKLTTKPKSLSAGTWNEAQMIADNSSYRRAAEAMLTSMYDATQEHFKKAGLTHVTVYRGMASTDPTVKSKLSNGQDGFDVSGGANLKRPLSSFSLDPHTAASFVTGNSGGGQAQPGSVNGIMAAHIPVQHVICGYHTGLGCYGEHELVVLGAGDHPYSFHHDYQGFIKGLTVGASSTGDSDQDDDDDSGVDVDDPDF